MSIDLKEYYHDLMQNVWSEADANGRFVESAFVDLSASLLEDAGEFDSFHYTPHRSAVARSVQVDGYGGDPLEQDGVLTLVISDFNQEESPASLTRTDRSCIVMT